MLALLYIERRAVNTVPASQINVRMDAKLKAEGDDALARAGFTATKAVRALWERASELSDKPDEIILLLTPEAAPKTSRREDAGHEELLAAADAGSGIFATALAESGIASAADPSSADGEESAYGDLREQSLRERLEGRGLLS